MPKTRPSKHDIVERRKDVWAMMKRGVDVSTMSKTLGCCKATVIYDQLALKMAARYQKAVWQERDRIRLTCDGWGKMPAGTFGTVLKVFENGPGFTDYAVLWDTGLKDLIGEDQAERLSPLEQLASVA